MRLRVTHAGSRRTPRPSTHSPPLPSRHLPPQVRMLLDSINYTTKGFVKLHRNNSSSVFESLITCGDLMTSHEMDDNAFPLPPTLLVTRAFAETCVAHLRGSHPDIDAFVDALDVYNTEMLQTSQRWLAFPF